MNHFGGNLQSLYLSEQFTVPAILCGLLRGAGFSLEASYNLLYLLFGWLNLWCAYALARRLRLSPSYAAASALAFAYGPFAVSDPHQVMIRMPVFTLPLLLIAYDSLRREASAKTGLAFGAVLLLQMLLPLGYSLMAGLALLLVFAAGIPGERAFYRTAAVSVLPAAVTGTVIYLHYRAGFSALGIRPLPFESADRMPQGLAWYPLLPGLSVTLAAALALGFRFGPKGARLAGLPLRVLAAMALLAALGLVRFAATPEDLRTLSLFRPELVWPGIALWGVLGLVLLGLDRLWPAGPEISAGLERGFVAVAAAGFALMLNHIVSVGGRDIAFGPLVGWQTFLPPLGEMRGPPRFGLLMALALPPLAFGWLDRKLSGSRFAPYAAAAVLTLTAAEALPSLQRYRIYGTSGRLAAQRLPEIYEHLRRLPQGLVIELPVDRPDIGGAGARAAFYSTTNWFPLANGYSSYFPPGFTGRIAALGRLTPGLKDRLGSAGVRYAVIHADALTEAERTLVETEFGERGVDRFRTAGPAGDWLGKPRP